MNPEEDFQQLMDEIYHELENAIHASTQRPLTEDEAQLVAHFSGVKYVRHEAR